jgi:hypothetical protein
MLRSHRLHSSSSHFDYVTDANTHESVIILTLQCHCLGGHGYIPDSVTYRVCSDVGTGEWRDYETVPGGVGLLLGFIAEDSYSLRNKIARADGTTVGKVIRVSNILVSLGMIGAAIGNELLVRGFNMARMVSVVYVV